MRSFCVADFRFNGELHAKQAYDYASLEQVPGCAEIIGHLSGVLWRSPDEFQTTLGPTGDELAFRWRASAPTAGIATLRCDDTLASLSLLATGLRPDADAITLDAFQRHLVQNLHDTGIEPSFDLVSLTERPLIATVNLHSPASRQRQVLAALADRCFAAAYFRYHRLS